MRREVCGSCGSAELIKFLNLGSSPLADAYTASPNEPSERYPLELAVCEDCKLVQLLEVVDGKTLFGAGYSFYTSASPPLSAYHREYAERVLLEHPNLARRFTLEVGCNDGDFIRWFHARNCKTLGVDPADGPVRHAQARGVPVLNAPFTRSLAEEIVDAHGHAGIVVANHVLAHVEDVSDVIAGVATALASDGVAYVEVQYLPDLLVNNAFDLIYHEHRNFFTLSSLLTAARRHGLVAVHAELTSRQLGSLRVELMHDGYVTNSSNTVINICDSEWWLNAGLRAYDGFQGRTERVRDRIWDLIEGERDLAGYGAPAKATTLLNFCEITHPDLRFVVDSTPAKQGRYIPGTGVPIVEPSNWVDRPPPEAYLILAWNYAREIIRGNEPGFSERGGRWILPIPAPMIL